MSTGPFGPPTTPVLAANSTPPFTTRAAHCAGPGRPPHPGSNSAMTPAGALYPADASPPALDLSAASLLSTCSHTRQQMTDPMLRTIEKPRGEILGHPTRRLTVTREP